LRLALQSFDESFLREILRVMYVPDHTINLEEDAPHVLGDKTLLQLGWRRRDSRHTLWYRISVGH
jgi:hypothetical protein